MKIRVENKLKLKVNDEKSKTVFGVNYDCRSTTTVIAVRGSLKKRYAGKTLRWPLKASAGSATPTAPTPPPLFRFKLKDLGRFS